MIHDIFPTPLWHITPEPYDAVLLLDLVDELYKGAYRIKEKYSSKNRSNRGGYQSPNFSWNDFHPQGKKYVDEIIINQLIECHGTRDIKTSHKVKSWWYNISGKGHWNIPHTHPDCNFALVWYLTPSDGLLVLMSPFPQRRTGDIDKHGDHIIIDAKKGDIIMFPSDIIHYVKPNPKDTDRISISMNLQFY